MPHVGRYLIWSERRAVMLAPLLLSTVHGLGSLTLPVPRKPLWRTDQPQRGWTSATSTYREYEVVRTLEGPTISDLHQYSASSFACHDFTEEMPKTELVAGEDLEVEWNLKVRSYHLHAVRPLNSASNAALHHTSDDPNC